MPEVPSQYCMQISCRLAKDTHQQLREALKNDRMNFQRFVDACIRAYLRRHPPLLKVIEEFRDGKKRIRSKLENIKLNETDRAEILSVLKENDDPVPPGCQFEVFLSCVCNRGTKGCDVQHEEMKE